MTEKQFNTICKKVEQLAHACGRAQQNPRGSFPDAVAAAVEAEKPAKAKESRKKYDPFAYGVGKMQGEKVNINQMKG